MKSFRKNLLSILGGTLLLCAISFLIIYLVFNSPSGLSLDSETRVQKSFWNDINHDKAIKAGANSFDNDGYKYFTLDLDDEYEAGYSNKGSEISVFRKDDYHSRIDFAVDKNFSKIANDSLDKLNDKNSGLSREQQEELEKLAIQKFKDFQVEYYKVNN